MFLQPIARQLVIRFDALTKSVGYHLAFAISHALLVERSDYNLLIAACWPLRLLPGFHAKEPLAILFCEMMGTIA